MTPLERVRKEKGYSQHKLASLADVEQANISRIERGQMTPSLEFAQRVSGVLGITELQILYPERYMQPDSPEAA
jgi:putative transcriptional regulator